MVLRCRIDGLILDACRHPSRMTLIAFDGYEPFEMDRVEAMYYELVAATQSDLLWLQEAGYRCLRQAPEFQIISQRLPA